MGGAIVKLACSQFSSARSLPVVASQLRWFADMPAALPGVVAIGTAKSALRLRSFSPVSPAPVALPRLIFGLSRPSKARLVPGHSLATGALDHTWRCSRTPAGA